MDKQILPVIETNDGQTDKIEHVSAMESTAQKISEISKAFYDAMTIIPWNWRQESDVAGLFLAFGG